MPGSRLSWPAVIPTSLASFRFGATIHVEIAAWATFWANMCAQNRYLVAHPDDPAATTASGDDYNAGLAELDQSIRDFQEPAYKLNVDLNKVKAIAPA